ncbi:MAG: ABC transporter permease [Verrucomicrobia bacterium]|nr:ABC transporter permease [Verrucomicrobiota bacterium]
MLAKAPGFTATAVLTLALGIGCATAIFSVIDAVLLRPFPFPQQERVVELRELDENGHAMTFAEPNFDDLRRRSTSFSALAEYNIDTQGVAGGSEPVRVDVSAVSEDFFRVLGVPPFKGRLLGSQTGTDSAVVSYGFWQRVLGGRANLESTTLRCAGHSFAVIGVLPPDASFPPNVDVWFPRAIYPPSHSRTGHNFRVIGRIREGVSRNQAAAEIATIGSQLKREYGPETDAASFGLTALRERFVKDVRGALWLLSAAVGLLLVSACFNVANLLLVRSAMRRQEMAVRAALGASRWALTKQHLGETILLTLSAAALGILFASWGIDAVLGIYHGNLPHVGAIAVNPAALALSLGMALVLGVALGFVPAFGVSPQRLQTQLQESGRAVTSGHSRVRNFFIIAQVALTMMLLIGAGLLGKSFRRLLEVNPGFQTQSVIAMTISQPWSENPEVARRYADAYRRLLERLQAFPGEIAVGGIDNLPLMGGGASGAFLINDGPNPPATLDELIQRYTAAKGTPRARYAEFRVASAGYFSAMKIPLLRGRVFQDADGRDAPHVALISETLARRVWPGENPIGKEMQFGGMDGDLHPLHVIGVVGDIRDQSLDAEPSAIVYVNYVQRPLHAAEWTIVLRAHGDRSSVITAMRRAAAATHPDVPLKFETLQEIVGASLDSRRFTMTILAVFAGAALALAMIGLYGVIAYITAQRTTEFGIRMALGAQRGDMLRLVLRQAFVLAAAGIGFGIIGALSATRVLRTLIWNVSPFDLATYGGLVLLLLLACLVASFLPARRATQIDPAVALRSE